MRVPTKSILINITIIGMNIRTVKRSIIEQHLFFVKKDPPTISQTKPPN
jgi:hypothetical protein